MSVPIYKSKTKIIQRHKGKEHHKEDERDIFQCLKHLIKWRDEKLTYS